MEDMEADMAATEAMEATEAWEWAWEGWAWAAWATEA